MSSKSKRQGQTAVSLFDLADGPQVLAGISAILRLGGAVMFGQTRDGMKLIVTAYLNGDKEQEYCEDPSDVVSALAELVP